MPKRISRFFTAALLLVLLASCDSKRVFDEYQSVPDSWNKATLITFNITAPDTTNAYNLYINLRNNNAYRYNNLFLIAELSYPNGKIIKDTLEYKMAAPNGALLGEGFTDLKENKLWYKGHDIPFIFEELGDYKVTIQHAMRKSGDVGGIINLEGVTDIGFRIEIK